MYRMQRYTFSVIVSVNLAFLMAYLAVRNWSYDGNRQTTILHREYTEGLVEHVEEEASTPDWTYIEKNLETTTERKIFDTSKSSYIEVRKAHYRSDMAGCGDVSLISHDATYNGVVKNGIKIIYQATRTPTRQREAALGLKFNGCDYSNCALQYCESHDYIERADLVYFSYQNTYRIPLLSESVRLKQTWLLMTAESPAIPYNEINSVLDGYMNGTITYKSDSDLPWNFGTVVRRTEPAIFNETLARSKTKGAYIYVSNCNSENYDRLGMAHTLSNYIDVSVLGGCGDEPPCARNDPACEYREHSGYHFYLSFENSLCSEYVTEKFYNPLRSPLLTVPVVVGGLSIDDYAKNAPPDSFIHLYNFTSVEALGKYLKHLMTDPDAYMKYHSWRQQYEVRSVLASSLSCKLCEIANMNGKFVGKQQGRISEWWNSGCKNLTITDSET